MQYFRDQPLGLQTVLSTVLMGLPTRGGTKPTQANVHVVMSCTYGLNSTIKIVIAQTATLHAGLLMSRAVS